jgi:hypothetical protein
MCLQIFAVCFVCRVQEIDILGQDMAIYSPEIYVLHNMLGQKIFHKYLVQIRSHEYIDKVVNSTIYVSICCVSCAILLLV